MNSNMLNDIHKRDCEEKLREAAATGDLDVIKSLIEKGVDVNSQNIINHWYFILYSIDKHILYSDIVYLQLVGNFLSFALIISINIFLGQHCTGVVREDTHLLYHIYSVMGLMHR